MTWGTDLKPSGPQPPHLKSGNNKSTSPWGWEEHKLVSRKAFIHLSCHTCHTNTVKETREDEPQGWTLPGSNPSSASYLILGKSLCLGLYSSLHPRTVRSEGQRTWEGFAACDCPAHTHDLCSTWGQACRPFLVSLNGHHWHHCWDILWCAGLSSILKNPWHP